MAVDKMIIKKPLVHGKIQRLLKENADVCFGLLGHRYHKKEYVEIY